MLFRRLYEEGLAQASYIIGCQRAQEAIVVDPNMDIDSYLRVARDEGVKITQVAETHIHADFASGARYLAAETGASLSISNEGGPDWTYGFSQEPNVSLLHDGDRISVGNVHLDILHTPGHTPEHLTFLFIDSARSNAYAGALTGDFLFIGDVGRPDLLERAVGQVGTMRSAAAVLYNSIQKFKKLPDHLQIWPGHGAGSACGKSMSSAEVSTLGYEKIANWALEPMSEDDFIERVLEGQVPAPPYFGAMKIRNRDGAQPPSSKHPKKLSIQQFEEIRTSLPTDTLIIDVRNKDEWDQGNIGGAVNIPLPDLHNQLEHIPKDKTVIVHCQRGARSAQAAETLHAFGYNNVHDLVGGYANWKATVG